MTCHFISESLAEECVPESDISNAFLKKLAGGHAEMKEQIDAGNKIVKVGSFHAVTRD